MPVPPLDLKAIWQAGQSYAEWLAASESAKREEMERIYAEVLLTAEDIVFLGSIPKPVHILALSEDWCGDVRRHLPVLARMCAEDPILKLRVVEKASRPELMVRYLTNGAEAIPIFVFLSSEFVEVGFWGPRPAECKLLMARGKAAGNIDEARAAIGRFYATDRNRSTINELTELFAIACAERV